MNGDQPGVNLHEADREAEIAMHLVTRSTRGFLQAMNMVSETNLAQVLIALWDSGLYEYIRRQGRVQIQAAASELKLDADILQVLIDYLVGRGLMRPQEGGYALTDKGQPYWNYITRGVLTSYIGGYNPLLVHLGPLLRKEIGLHDPCLNRLGRLVAVGANYSLLGSGMVPWVLEAISHLGGRFVMDLGCGAGVFLIHLALQWPEGQGIGIDCDAEAIAEAEKNARKMGVSERVHFFQDRVSDKGMKTGREWMDQVDTITAMFMLHELGGAEGPGAIARCLASLRAQFPGRKLLMLEGTRADPQALCASPPRTFGQLDYSFFHPLSRQGHLRTPEEWRKIIEDSGGTLLDCIPGFKLVPSWICLYIISLQ